MTTSKVIKWELFDRDVYKHTPDQVTEFVKAHFNELYVAAYNNVLRREQHNNNFFRTNKTFFVGDVSDELIDIVLCYKNEDYSEVYSYTDFINYIITNREMIPFWLL